MLEFACVLVFVWGPNSWTLTAMRTATPRLTLRSTDRPLQSPLTMVPSPAWLTVTCFLCPLLLLWALLSYRPQALLSTPLFSPCFVYQYVFYLPKWFTVYDIHCMHIKIIIWLSSTHMFPTSNNICQSHKIWLCSERLRNWEYFPVIIDHNVA